MKFEIEVDEEKIKQRIIQGVADQVWYEVDRESRDKLVSKIYKSIDWNKMAPYVQEAVLKMAAEKLFNK